MKVKGVKAKVGGQRSQGEKEKRITFEFISQGPRQQNPNLS